VFSQYYDSAYALCQYLSKRGFPSIGLYANSSSSKLFENGEIQSVDRELLKEKVNRGLLKLLVGTDAASTGLNLQRLGSLINLDLPWNPTLLEQRKGRVQRGTIGKRIPFCNLRYDDGVEARLFNVLTGRIQEITNIFGTIPDFITDKWVGEMLENKRLEESDLIQFLGEAPKSPFSTPRRRHCFLWKVGSKAQTHMLSNFPEDIRWKRRFAYFSKALERLSDAVELGRERPLSDLEKLGVIQAFEFTHELAWNVLKDFLMSRGSTETMYGSRDATRQAFAAGLIQDGEVWMDMILDRNRSSHTYDSKTAESIYAAAVNRYYPEFIELQNFFRGME